MLHHRNGGLDARILQEELVALRLDLVRKTGADADAQIGEHAFRLLGELCDSFEQKSARLFEFEAGLVFFGMRVLLFLGAARSRTLSISLVMVFRISHYLL